MKILMTASEAVPYAKTGGLADVVTGLSKALAGRGHDVTAVLPHYPAFAEKSGLAFEDAGLTVNCEIAGTPMFARLLATTLPAGPASVRLVTVDHREMFDREGLYGGPHGAYQDNCRRWCFFSRAAVAAAHALQFEPDVVHAHDWQTGLVPVLIDAEERPAGRMNCGTVLTIHNLAFQGVFDSWHMRETGLGWEHFTFDKLEYYGELSLLKGGLSTADRITTVSPTYAEEIRTPAFGCGMQDVLRHRSEDLVGILNGVDTDDWNPATDPHIAQTFDVDTVAEGKAANQAALQAEFGLPQRPDVPVFGMVSRFSDQKGLDLIRAAADRFDTMDAQFVFLGTGDGSTEQFLREWSARRPHNVNAHIGFDNGLAHRIEAGATAFLMPSSFEPCGLNQMYSQLYGTPPVVTAVGGLADSVVDCTKRTLADGTASGFVLPRYSAESLVEAAYRVLEWWMRPDDVHRLRQQCMRLDRSWDASAGAYETVYRAAADAGA